MFIPWSLLVAFSFSHSTVRAQSQSVATATSPACSSTIAPKNGQPSVAAGWNAQVVASGLTKPRGLIFDSQGHLLAVQQGRGIVNLNLTGDAGACVRQSGNGADVLRDSTLTHGIELSRDGKTLYASSPSGVFAWAYDASQARNTSGPKLLIGNMGSTADHNTRTLLLSRQVPDLLVVSRGSTSNLDLTALNRSSGVSTIKAFNLTNITDAGYNYQSDGLLLGWGLRNDVGVGEHPSTGGIYSVENSVDEFTREGQNIHENNPGEELNFLGYLNGTQYAQQGGFFGYPDCFAAWNVSEIPQNQNIQVGTQFAIGDQNATINDTFCQQDAVAPRLTFQAHMAPLDIKFNSNGTAAWVSFHGSWDRTDPIGYKVSVIGFKNGEPTDAANSSTAAVDIVSNPDLSKCPNGCFRPAGLTFDSQGRLYMSSDATGEIFVITQADGSAANNASPSSGLPSASGTATGAAASATKSKGAAPIPLEGCSKVSHYAAVLAGIMALPLL